MNHKEFTDKLVKRVSAQLLKEIDLDVVSINSVHGLARDSYLTDDVIDKNEENETFDVIGDETDSIKNSEHMSINITHRKDWQKQSKFIECVGLYLNGDINIDDAIAMVILGLDGDAIVKDEFIKKLNDLTKGMNDYWDSFNVSKYNNPE